MPPRLVSDRMLDLFPMERTGGRHVSSAIHRIMQSLYPTRFTSDPINEVRANLGNAMERAVIAAMQERNPGRYVRPGTIELDDIYGTPDLWDLWGVADPAKVRTLKPRVVEIKLTWASSRRAEDPEDSWFWRYWEQGKAYQKMSGPEFVGVTLIVVYVVGDWKDGPPIGYQWDWDFPQSEVDETWEMIKANAIHEEGSRRGNTATSSKVGRSNRNNPGPARNRTK